jgi:hypothetical protein
VKLITLALLGPLAFAQTPSRPWLNPLFADPAKLSPDGFTDDEWPSIALGPDNRLWVAWTSCRPKTNGSTGTLEWPDDGVDHIRVRSMAGERWSPEETVSTLAGVNYKPAVVATAAGAHVFWTARREGEWSLYHRGFTGGRWSNEERVPQSEGALEVRATGLDDGAVLTVTTHVRAPRLGLWARIYRNGTWQAPVRLDQGDGRCHRRTLLALPDGEWIIAWDEERKGDYDIWVSRSGRQPPERITDARLWDTTPALARTPEGRVWLAWESKEPRGGRFSYQARSIFAKYWDGAKWQWAPSPFASAEPGRLTRHSRYWATEGANAEERSPVLVARANGDLWLLWCGGGRMDNTSLAGRVFRAGRWSEPMLLFHDPLPYSAFTANSVRAGADPRAQGRGIYQTPLFAQLATALDERAGRLWLAYEVSKRRLITDAASAGGQDSQEGRGGWGAEVFTHWLDLDQREFRYARVPDDPSPLPELRSSARPARGAVRSIEINGRPYRLLFGDVHGHTENDAIGTIDMYYTHGLMVSGMDFVASTNHDYSPDLISQSDWAYTQALSTLYNRVPDKVALSGYEWTATPGQGHHRAMYFLRDDGPLFRCTTQASNHIDKLYRLLRGTDVILQPHHSGWEGYDAQLQPVYEVTSGWRDKREEDPSAPQGPGVRSMWQALDRGYRIAFVGSSDTHFLGPGEDNGITGAYVADNSREAVFEAIRNRRVFASTGLRALIDFRANGVFIGGETKTSAPVRLTVTIEAESPIAKAEIIRDRRVIHAAAGAGPALKFTYADQTGATSRGWSYYYVRLTAADGNQAWTSPVWVDWQ